MADDRPKSFFLAPQIHEYLVGHGAPPDEIAQGLIAETRRLGPRSMMQVAPEEGAFLTVLTRIAGARRAIEVGTFTGYSALCIARGLPDDGALLCCDVSEEWTRIGRPYWEKAGVAHKIDLRLGPALDTLRALPREPGFDFAFIDADKPNYLNYYEEILKRLRPGGVIVADNVLWFGNVVNPDDDSEQTRAIRAFNDALARDARVECAMLPLSDGVTIARKR
jgi:caffeoyl-CoA O-methyltransferase